MYISINLIGFAGLHGHNVPMHMYAVFIVLYVQCMLQYVATYFGKLEKQIDEAKSTDTD